MLGSAISFEIARRGHGEDRRLDQLARDEAREARLAEADGEVDAFRHQIADMFAGHELDRELGIALAEGAEPAGQHQRQEEGIDVDLEAAAHGRGRAGGDSRCVLDGVEMRLHLLVEAPPLVGERHRTRRPIEQPHIQPRLQAADRPADAGIGDADQFRRFDEAAALDDRRQHAHPGQNPVHRTASAYS